MQAQLSEGTFFQNIQNNKETQSSKENQPTGCKIQQDVGLVRNQIYSQCLPFNIEKGADLLRGKFHPFFANEIEKEGNVLAALMQRQPPP